METIPVKAFLFINKRKFKGIANLFGIPIFGNGFVVTGNSFTCNSYAPALDGSISGEMVPVASINEREAAAKRLLSGGFVEITESNAMYVAEKPVFEEMLQEC
ncbi:MAG: hypothetical protein JWL92_340 [Candidatus Nomurabacteria bacterium]|nr:hypothetical protein [Candidatus Nomurabacteria bacterium]